MLRGAMVAPIARPNWIARATAPRFSTGSVPGRARSIALACEFGSAPNAVDEPEKILLAVVSWACVSSPITTSHCIAGSLVQGFGRILAQQPARLALLVRVGLPCHPGQHAVLFRLDRLAGLLQRLGHVLVDDGANVG